MSSATGSYHQAVEHSSLACVLECSWFPLPSMLTCGQWCWSLPVGVQLMMIFISVTCPGDLGQQLPQYQYILPTGSSFPKADTEQLSWVVLALGLP